MYYEALSWFGTSVYRAESAKVKLPISNIEQQFMDIRGPEMVKRGHPALLQCLSTNPQANLSMVLSPAGECSSAEGADVCRESRLQMSSRFLPLRRTAADEQMSAEGAVSWPQK